MALYTLSKLSNLNTEAYPLVGSVHNWMKGYACSRHMTLLVQHVTILDGHHIQRKPTSHHKQLCTSAGCEKKITSTTLSPISYVYGPGCRSDVNQHLHAITLSPVPGSIFLPRNHLHLHSQPYTTGTFRNVSYRYHHSCARKCGYRTSSVLHVCTHVPNCRNYATAKSSQFTWKNHLYKTYLESLLDENEAIEQRRISGIQTVSDNRRYMELLPVVALVLSIKTRYEEFEELRALLEDKDMREMAKEDLTACQADIDEMESNLFAVLASKNTMEVSDIMLEVSSGAGGQEAMLFAGEVLKMYAHFAASKGWAFHVEKLDKAYSVWNSGGIRFGSASVSGHHVYDDLKFESGVHRVQRVPVTQRASRLHTSTISVAIISQPSEIDIVLHPKDLKVDTYASSVAGGQYDKTESAVRITHLPTGTVAACQESRSQIENRFMAMQMLRSRIYNAELQEQLSKEKSQRKMQIGNKERSEKIRTYNFNQDRITDHRLGKNYFGVDNFMRGDASLGSMIDDLHVEARQESLEIILDEFAESRKKVSKRRK